MGAGVVVGLFSGAVGELEDEDAFGCGSVPEDFVLGDYFSVRAGGLVLLGGGGWREHWKELKT